jgi:hypothetical protein
MSSTRFCRLALAAVAGAIAAGWSVPAAAHQASMTYAELAVGEGNRVVDYTLRISSRDLGEALGVGVSRDVTDAEITAGADRLYDYAFAHIDLEADGQPCAITRRPLEIQHAERRFAQLSVRMTCPEPIRELALDYDLFFDLDPGHIGMLAVNGEVAELTIDASRFVYTLGAAPLSGAWAFVHSGIDHILFGIDHILFLVALLLMGVISRDPGTGWAVRGVRDQIAYTGVIVTSFTLAHSMTLIAAALGWLTLSSRVVETAIAASIVYVAVENVVRPDPPRRYLVTFAFGLVHGLGFASMLRPLLPDEAVVAPLLLFNVGVEIGQLGIVIAVGPLLLVLARIIGAQRYRTFALPIAGAGLAAIGLTWMIERAFDVVLLGL